MFGGSLMMQGRVRVECAHSQNKPIQFLDKSYIRSNYEQALISALESFKASIVLKLLIKVVVVIVK